MDGSRLLILILILIVAGVIGGTFIVEAIRKKDFGDQVSGKKPEHKLGKNQKSHMISLHRKILRSQSIGRFSEQKVDRISSDQSNKIDLAKR